MTKEERIQEEWIKILGSEQVEIDETNICPDGWFRRDLAFGIISYEELKLKGDFDEMKKQGYWYVRPKSLQGLENNRDWIKIESEEDLPKDGWHWTRTIIEDNDSFQTHYEDIDIRYHTHYQPIYKPEPPLF